MRLKEMFSLTYGEPHSNDRDGKVFFLSLQYMCDNMEKQQIKHFVQITYMRKELIVISSTQ